MTVYEKVTKNAGIYDVDCSYPAQDILDWIFDMASSRQIGDNSWLYFSSQVKFQEVRKICRELSGNLWTDHDDSSGSLNLLSALLFLKYQKPEETPAFLCRHNPMQYTGFTSGERTICRDCGIDL